MKGHGTAVLLLMAFYSVCGAPTDQHTPEVTKAIGLIHHLTYLIDYLVQYVVGSNDRRTPPEAADYYQKALVEGQNQAASGGSQEYKPNAARARQETEIIHKMMKA